MADDMDISADTPEQSEVMASNDDPRGTKRKATDELLGNAPRRIKALSQTVVNKIAAGEIIVAPVHALKELLENAVDAGSTSIEVVVKDGGLKMLQITDNGSGINKDDMGILCERFTTSKLKTFEDLASIGTYGFRGEALASISHIAHLSVTTRTKDSDCAWRALYSDGKLIPPKPGGSAEPKAVAGRQGTQITVEDLFYNVPSRRRAFRNTNEEYSKVLDMVGKYAIHCDGIAFSCKKHGESSMGVAIQSTAKTIDRVRQIYGNAVANELIPFKIEDQKLGFKAKGLITNANYSIKKTTMLLFINHRCVESTAIRKSLESVYSAFLPKGGHPYIYATIEIEPHRIDVNVHPTKREVNFLHEDEIIERISDAVQEKLAAVDTSRSFMTQTVLPGAGIPSASALPPTTQASSSRGTAANTPAKPSQTPKRPYENEMVRTDARVRKITSMLPPAASSASGDVFRGLKHNDAPNGEYEDDSQPDYEVIDTNRRVIKLASIRTLKTEVRDQAHEGLIELFGNHTWVGVVDEWRRLAAVQNGIKLYLVDYGAVCFEFFYQLALTDFGNFGQMRLQEPLSIRDLMDIAVELEKNAEIEETGEVQSDWEGVAAQVTETVFEKREMMSEYFSLIINDEGEIESIPLLLKGYTPNLAKLPTFLLRLGPRVNWEDELECFDCIIRELAIFYVPESVPRPVQFTGATQATEGEDSEMTGASDSVPAEIREQIEVSPTSIYKKLVAHTSSRTVVTHSNPDAFPSALKQKHSTGQNLAPEEVGGQAEIDTPCPKCENPVMKFTTVQLRSADEGATVFYNCPNCGYRYNTNN
ncbi:DNA mismatch repair protein [Orbilia oligospora]|uniref:DNA mismatch repair protein n=1 Tax=Orbilia oligospora TaxID=2813651 RepID=A0A7C8NCS2_ORBOL|nr:DNA mismatch repair protein [Orbilia oligospora]